MDHGSVDRLYFGAKVNVSAKTQGATGVKQGFCGKSKC